MLLAKWSKHELDLLFHLKKQKIHKIYEIAVIWSWTSGTEGQWPLRDGEEMRLAVQLPQLTELPGCDTVRRDPGGLSKIPELRKQSWESREAKAPRHCKRTEQEREMHVERILESAG